MGQTNLGPTDYVLGTGGDELARLKLQHSVWRDLAQQAWRRGGIRKGIKVLDVGCGPGFATLDLCDAVGPQGKVTAIEGNEKFIAAAQQTLSGQSKAAIFEQADLDRFQIDAAAFDFIWCRWVATFVTQPERLAKQIAAGLAPGGAAVFHEYLHYGTWRLIPRVAEFEQFVEAVQESWRIAGGIPDIASELVKWLEAEGLSVEMRPLIFSACPGEPMWEWPSAFVETNLSRLEDLGVLAGDQVSRISHSWKYARKTKGIRMVTPCVAEIIARRD